MGRGAWKLSLSSRLQSVKWCFFLYTYSFKNNMLMRTEDTFCWICCTQYCIKDSQFSVFYATLDNDMNELITNMCAGDLK